MQQCGFTKGGGCDQILLVFETVVEYFNKQESTVSALYLTKAYDRLNQYRPISILKLYDIGIPRNIIMIFCFCLKT